MDVFFGSALLILGLFGLVVGDRPRRPVPVACYDPEVDVVTVRGGGKPAPWDNRISVWE